MLQATNVTIVIPTLEDIVAAAKIKANYPISYADAFAVSTAIKENVPVLTGDPEFQHVETIVTVEWL